MKCGIVWLGLLACVAAGCKKEGKKRTGQPPLGGSAAAAVDPPGDAQTPGLDAAVASRVSALVAIEGRLEKVGVTGASEVLSEVGSVDHCDVDLDHHVVWMKGSGEVRAYDLVDKQLRSVASGVPELAPYWIAYRDTGDEFWMSTAGTADELSDCVALVINVAMKPTVGGAAVGDGDRAVYCYQDEVAEPLIEQYVEEKKAYDQARLLDADYVASLVARRDGPRYSYPEVEAPSAPKVEVDDTLCDESPEDCGTATHVGGGRLWSVVTSNSRGDFYHETSQLYDSETRTFWNPATGARQKKPFVEDDSNAAPDLELLEASPDGQWALWDGVILSTTEAALTETRVQGTFCGWL